MPISSVSRSTQLSSSAQGASVRELQQALADAGYDPGPVDGDFGPRTRAAVMERRVRALQLARARREDTAAP